MNDCVCWGCEMNDIDKYWYEELNKLATILENEDDPDESYNNGFLDAAELIRERMEQIPGGQ